MATPSPSQFHRPTLEIAAEATGDGFTPKDFIDRLIPKMQLTEDDLKETVSSGKYTKVETRAHFARANLKSAGLMDNPRFGHWQITSQGRDYLVEHTGPISASEMKRLQRIATSGSDAAGEIESGADHTDDIQPIEQMADSHQQHQEMLADEILGNLKSIAPAGFERLVVALLSKMGYGDGRVTGKSGDQGIDGILDEDTLGLEKVYVQAKRYDNAQVGEPEIRNFSGSLVAQGATKGVFITTSTFSATARQTAQSISLGNQFIRLIDGRELAELMIKHGVGVVTEITYEVKKLDANYFAEV